MGGLLAKYPNGINDFASSSNNAISVGGLPSGTSEVNQVAKGIAAASLESAKPSVLV